MKAEFQLLQLLSISSLICSGLVSGIASRHWNFLKFPWIDSCVKVTEWDGSRNECATKNGWLVVYMVFPGSSHPTPACMHRCPMSHTCVWCRQCSDCQMVRWRIEQSFFISWVYILTEIVGLEGWGGGFNSPTSPSIRTLDVRVTDDEWWWWWWQSWMKQLLD